MTGEDRPARAGGTTDTPPTTLDRLTAAKVVPVVVIDDDSAADDLADALVQGGITAIEVTLRTPAGLKAIERLAGRTDLVAGAGTVLDPEQVSRAVDAGARFVVSPGLSAGVVEATLRRSTLSVPGVATASELQSASNLGLQAVKFFPAELLGGLEMIEALSQPFPHLRFLPSGGITLGSATTYLASPQVFAVGGSWMVPRRLIRNHQFEEIARLSAQTTHQLSGAL